jgi:NADH:ubiquinone oxidoreductase subunit E
MTHTLSAPPEVSPLEPTMEQTIANFSHGQILKGQYLRPIRSKKGKLKGLELHAGEKTYAIKLPKYLRPMLTWELEPQCFVKVLAYPDHDTWQAVNLLPLSEAEAITLQAQWQNSAPQSVPDRDAPALTRPDKATSMCIQVCRKGKCYKQGGKHIWQILQAEVEANPDLQHVSIEATGCMKACKKGPNVRVLPTGKMLNRVTPDHALNVLQDC